MQQNFNLSFSGFPDSSKVWIYSADRFFKENEKAFVHDCLEEFTQQWATHGKELFASASTFLDSFIVFVVDESKVKASGCSIDTSVRLVKSIGAELNIDFFDRLWMLVELNGSTKRVHFNDIKNFANSYFYDTTINNLGDFRSKFKIKVSESNLFLFT